MATAAGSTHNIYVGAIADFSITNSYVHDANVGHEIKSRAANNTITNDRIFDNASTASYSIDLPNGGDATITNNVIEQGPNSQNPAIIAYGEEGHSNPGATVAMTDDTIVNDRAGGTFALDPDGTPIVLAGDAVFGLTLPGATILATRPTLDLAPIAFITPPASSPATPPPSPILPRHPKASWRRTSLSIPTMTQATLQPAPIPVTDPNPIPTMATHLWTHP